MALTLVQQVPAVRDIETGRVVGHGMERLLGGLAPNPAARCARVSVWVWVWVSDTIVIGTVRTLGQRGLRARLRNATAKSLIPVQIPLKGFAQPKNAQQMTLWERIPSTHCQDIMSTLWERTADEWKERKQRDKEWSKDPYWQAQMRGFVQKWQARK